MCVCVKRSGFLLLRFLLSSSSVADRRPSSQCAEATKQYGHHASIANRVRGFVFRTHYTRRVNGLVHGEVTDFVHRSSMRSKVCVCAPFLNVCVCVYGVVVHGREENS